ncbi:MAG: CoB--CoM heterodisulfide reductase iron-sulfur subunit B family protein [Negativicutes bacterium]|nr:CoB--CoM heterodisulfide reductase iron-sulfur subunit B family protein [Negativicutes bacterium]
MKDKMGYYPGCSLLSTAAEYDLSLRAVFAALGQELTEIPDWNCCGATAGHSTSESLADALVLRNLAQAEKAGFQEVVVPCAECYNLFKVTDYKMKNINKSTTETNTQILNITGNAYHGGLEVVHPLQLLSQPHWLSLIEKAVVKPLTGMKVATYYGCLLTRPPQVAFDDVNYPLSMDTILTAAGAEVRKWSYKTDCCGASLALPRTETVEKFVGHLTAMARRAGAEALAVACPLCQANLDTRQKENRGAAMPIFYFSELMGLSFGQPAARQWLKKHIVDPLPLVTRLELL